MALKSPPIVVPIPWAGVRSWLDTAEAMQHTMGGSTEHIPRAQLLALSQLASFSEEPKMPKEEDHVSKLMRK